MNADAPNAHASPPERECDRALFEAIESYWAALQRGEQVDPNSWAEKRVSAEDLQCLHLVETIHDAARMVAEDSQCGDDSSVNDQELGSTQSYGSEPLDSDPLDTPSQFAAGDRIGNYEIREVLGRGGQAVSCKAWDPQLARHVVLKLYHRAETAEERERILAEGRKLARVRSPYVPQCYAVEQAGDVPCLVLEYIPGRNLTDLHRSAPLTVRQALRLTAQVAVGLAAVHACGLLHCDIKPGNILIGDDGIPRLVDFGLSTSLGDPALAKPSGTLAFMAPEKARGEIERVDPRTDVFGLGATLYFLLTGTAPYEGKTKEELFRAARNGDVTPVRRRNSTLPAGASAICMRCLAKAPELRFDSARQLAKTIGAHLRRRRAVAVSLVLLLALGIVSGGIAAVSMQRDSPDANTGEPDLFTNVRIPHFVNEGSDQVASGLLLQNGYPRVEDDIRIEVEFSQPAYCFLIALNPDGKTQLCHPENAKDAPPGPIDQLKFPADADAGFSLTDGAGQQAFLVLAHPDPLPPLDDWRAELESIKWPGADQDGAWEWKDDKLSRLGQVRGDTRKLKTKTHSAFENACRLLETKFPGASVYGISFPVKPR